MTAIFDLYRQWAAFRAWSDAQEDATPDEDETHTKVRLAMEDKLLALPSESALDVLAKFMVRSLEGSVYLSSEEVRLIAAEAKFVLAAAHLDKILAENGGAPTRGEPPARTGTARTRALDELNGAEDLLTGLWMALADDEVGSNARVGLRAILDRAVPCLHAAQAELRPAPSGAAAVNRGIP